MGGGGTGGFMTARGAGNLLTRTTAILATLFFIVSFALTVTGNMDRRGSSVTDRQDITAAPGGPAAPGAAPPDAPPPTELTPPADDTNQGPSLDTVGGGLDAPLPDAGVAPAEPAAPAKK